MAQLTQVLTADLLTDADREPAPLPTIWTVPDDLWERIAPILADLDPPKPLGRSRIDARAALDAILYRPRLAGVEPPAEGVSRRQLGASHLPALAAARRVRPHLGGRAGGV